MQVVASDSIKSIVKPVVKFLIEKKINNNNEYHKVILNKYVLMAKNIFDITIYGYRLLPSSLVLERWRCHV